MRLPDDARQQRLMLHRVGSVAALIGIVPLADYSGAEAESRFADIAWLAPRVRRHAELVEWAMQRSSVFPAPFGTLYTSLDSLSAFMLVHEATIAGFLQAVAGKEEWELRAGARFDSPEILDQLACKAWPDLRELSKGARYMRLCRDRSALLDFGRDEAAGLVRDFVAEIEVTGCRCSPTWRRREGRSRRVGNHRPVCFACGEEGHCRATGARAGSR